MKRLILLLFLAVVLVLAYTLVSSAQNKTNHFLSDEEFFQVLNLDYPGLNTVKEYYKNGDLIRAKKEFVVYLKKRQNPRWFFDWQDFNLHSYIVKDSGIIDDADRHVNNELYAHNAWYKYGDTIDWTADHSYDHYDEWVWQLNHHYCWINLAKAYWDKGDEKYAKAFVKQLNSWIDQCRVPIKAWNSVGSVWRTLDTGLRMQQNWPDLLYRFLASPSFDDESIIKMVKSFYNHAIHLRNHNTANNWLAVEMNGLYIVGGLFPEFKESKDWRQYSIGRLYEQEQQMFYPDGAQVELSPFYHSLSVLSMVSVYKFAKLNNYHLPEDFVARLESAFEIFVKLRMPDGRMPSINDSQWIDSKSFISEAAALFPERNDFKYFSSEGKEGRIPAYTSVWLPWAGWYVMRSGWDEDALYLLFEVGPYGAAHQHEDKLSFILHAYGQRLITECGYYSYDKSDWRKYALSARGHNVVRVDGKDQKRSVIMEREAHNYIKKEDGVRYSVNPLTNVWISNKSNDVGEGYYTNGFGDDLDTTVTHHRVIRFVKNRYFVVTDVFTPSDTFYHTYETWFHFNTPFYGVDDDLGIVYSNDDHSANVAIVALNRASTCTVISGQKEPEIQGWKAVPGGGNDYHCSPVATPTYRVSGKGIVKATYLFIPYPINNPMPVKKIKCQSANNYIVYLVNGDQFSVILEY